MSSFLDKTGLTKLWNLIKSYIDKNHPKYEILGNVDAPDVEIETPNLGGGGSSGAVVGGNSSYIFPNEVSKAFSYVLCGVLYEASYDTFSFSGQIISPEEIEKIKNACDNLTSTNFIVELTGSTFYRGLLKALSPSKTEEELDILLEELKNSTEENGSVPAELKLMKNMKMHFNCSSSMSITGNIDTSTEANESIYTFDFLTAFGSSSHSEGDQFIMTPICVIIGIMSENEVMYNVTLGASNIGV